MRYTKHIVLFLYMLYSAYSNASAASSAYQNQPKHEVRAVWLTTIGGLDWPHSYSMSEASANKQKKELTNILDKLKCANINTVLLQTRIRGTVIYPSSIEPWDGCMSGKPGTSPKYDPLQFVVEECHKRGMEIHAWIVAIPIGKWNGLGCKTIRSKHPKMVVRIGSDGYINPNNPYAGKYIAGICKEVANKYDIDGIHLDYIRYPEVWKQKISKDKGRDNITRIVSEIHDAVKSIKPWIKMSCAPIGKYDDLSRYSSRGWNAYDKGCQDVQTWLRTGLMDQIYPMMYFKGNQFFPFAIDWKENSFGKTVVPGLGIYFLSESGWPLDEIQRQMHVSRAFGMGFAFFRNKYLCDNIKGLYEFTANAFCTYPSLIPPMAWCSSKKPCQPKTIKVNRQRGYEIISWERPEANPIGGCLYNVYASSKYPVDIDDARNILAQRLKDNFITIQPNGKLFYAVTSIDRFGNESSALQEPKPEVQNFSSGSFIPNDGKRMALPPKGSIMDADFLILKSMSGNFVYSMPYKKTYGDISNVKEGIYSVYSINRKDVLHRLGFLLIKR